MPTSLEPDVLHMNQLAAVVGGGPLLLQPPALQAWKAGQQLGKQQPDKRLRSMQPKQGEVSPLHSTRYAAEQAPSLRSVAPLLPIAL